MKTIIIGGFSIIIFIASVIIFLNSRQNIGNSGNTSPEEAQSAIEDKDTQTSSNESLLRYVEYSKDRFEKYADKRRVLYFHANWCPVCVPLNKEFSQNQVRIPSDVIIFKVDYDLEQSLIDKYNITYQHTFVQVDSIGNEVVRWSGGNLADVLEKIK